jgi:hypothetical protein
LLRSTSAANAAHVDGTCGRSWPSMRPITTADDLIAADSSARPSPTTLSRTSPRSGSSAGLSSAASSTNTSEPHRSPAQDRRPSSGTPQGRLDFYATCLEPDLAICVATGDDRLYSNILLTVGFLTPSS